jgi:hypothetical protein
MMAGMFRFVCANGMVCGDTLHDVRVRHNGDAVNTIIDGAYTLLESFETLQVRSVTVFPFAFPANYRRSSGRPLQVHAAPRRYASD